MWRDLRKGNGMELVGQIGFTLLLLAAGGCVVRAVSKLILKDM